MFGADANSEDIQKYFFLKIITDLNRETFSINMLNSFTEIHSMGAQIWNSFQPWLKNVAGFVDYCLSKTLFLMTVMCDYSVKMSFRVN